MRADRVLSLQPVAEARNSSSGPSLPVHLARSDAESHHRNQSPDVPQNV